MESSFEVTPEIRKYIDQVERKKQYNRDYYHSKVKPKRSAQKQELELYRQQCTEFKSQLELSESSSISQLNEEIRNLSELVQKYKSENNALIEALNVARQRNYEILIQKADDFLPNVKGISL